jgi:hypothetical protein
MKDITAANAYFAERMAFKCFGDKDINLCPKRSSCECRLAAELKAYRCAILPKGFDKFSIFDYSGLTEKDEANLKEEEKEERRAIASRAKEIICKYCWASSFENMQDARIQKDGSIESLSVMDKRHVVGNCVVIYGASQKPMGRTMLASIIMREAINRRFYSNANALQTYDWVEFSTLRDYASIKDTKELMEYQTCDWLVVDNILSQVHTTGRQQQYVSSVLDPFFIYRIENKLPTIVVFKFNIKDQHINLQNFYGIGIDRIVNDEDTFIVPLVQNGKDG